MEIPYKLLSKEFHSQHEFCLDLVNELEKLLTEEDYVSLKTQVINIEGKPPIEKEEHILDYLLRIDAKDIHDKYLTNHIIHATLIDTIYFIKEALSASTKQRLTVALALIRKPFVYNLVVLLRVFFTSDFLDDFNSKEDFDSASIPKNDLLELIELSTATLITNSITKDDIYDFIFNKDEPESLINISNKALHPSTTRHKQSSTGIQNINFIFSIMSDIENQWSYFYARLRVLLIYLVEVCDFIIAKQLNLGSEFYQKRLREREKIYLKFDKKNKSEKSHKPT